MTLLGVGRTFRWGLLHFWRNIWLSLAATGVMLLTLAMLAILLVITVVGSEFLRTVEAKVDVAVFMADTATEQQILEVRNDLIGRPDVADVQYITREQVLATVRARHVTAPGIELALRELGENPFQAALVVKAHSVESYPAIAESLKSPRYQPFVSEATYEDNRAVIALVTQALSTARRIGVILTITLAVIAILVTFNTIALAIYGYHEEIEIMHLVGASRWYIRGPFLIEGLLQGSIAAVLTLLYFFPFVRALSPSLAAYLADSRFDLARWVGDNVVAVILLFLVTGVLLSTISSWIAVRRYVR